MIIADAKGEETEEEGKLSTAIAKRRGGEKTRNYGWESERVSETNKRSTAGTVCSLNEREYRALVLCRQGLLSEKSKDEGTEE